MNLFQKSKIYHPLSLFCFTLFLVFTYTTILYAHENEEQDVAIIHVDEEGFHPPDITIPVGTEVIFENVGDSSHWPASDDHPSHTLYDGTNLKQHCDSEHANAFDSCIAISAGKSWSFVFKKSGVFGYHDHLFPHLGGEITVETTTSEFQNDDRGSLFSRIFGFFREIPTMISDLFVDRDKEELVLNVGTTEGDLYERLKVAYKEMVFQFDPREAIHALQEESLQDVDVSALCHDVLHEIGHSAYEKYGSFGEAAQFQSSFCNSGYVHGIFESYFESVDNPLSGLMDQCSTYASVNGRVFDLWQCYHGIGHGFMYLAGGDLDQALLLCDENFKKAIASICQNGVFMEVFNLEILDQEGKFVDSDNPFLTCRDRDVAKGDCYLYVPTYLSQTKGQHFSEMFDECNEAEFGYKESCIHGIGSEAIKRNMSNPDVVFRLCSQAGSFANEQACVEGVVGMYMNQKGSYESGFHLCESAPQRYQDACEDLVVARSDFFK